MVSCARRRWQVWLTRERQVEGNMSRCRRCWYWRVLFMQGRKSWQWMMKYCTNRKLHDMTTLFAVTLQAAMSQHQAMEGKLIVHKYDLVSPLFSTCYVPVYFVPAFWVSDFFFFFRPCFRKKWDIADKETLTLMSIANQFFFLSVSPPNHKRSPVDQTCPNRRRDSQKVWTSLM